MFSFGVAAVVEIVGRQGAGGVQGVDLLVRGGEGAPARVAGVDAAADRAVFGGLQPEVCRLDAQRRVVGHHRRRRVLGLPERGADDPVVGHLRVEAVLDEEVLLHPVDLDAERARPAGRERHRGRERAAGADAQILDRAQRGAGGAPDVVEPGLQRVELLDDRQRDDDVGVAEAVDGPRIGDEHRGVEHDPRADTGGRRP